MAVTTKENHKAYKGRKNDGGLVKPVNAMDYSELKEYIHNKYTPHIVESQMIFSIYGSDGTLEYDYKGDDAEKEIMKHYTSISDYTEDTLHDNTIYKMDGWELYRVDIDPETGEEYDRVELDLVNQDNTYNFLYKGRMDLNWRVYEDKEYEKFFYVIHPHLGDDPRGNYGKALILEGYDKEELLYRFFENFISGQISIYVKFDDDSEVYFDAKQDSDVFRFEVAEMTDVEPDSLGAELIDDFKSFDTYDSDEFIEEVIDSTISSSPKMQHGGVAIDDADDDEPQVYVSVGKHGQWITVSDYMSGDDLIEYVEGYANGKDYSFTKWKGFARDLHHEDMSESDFDEVIEGWEAFDESDFPISVIDEFMADSSYSTYAEVIKEMKDKYYGSYGSMSDFAEQLVDEGIYTPKTNEMYVSDLDKRLIAGDDADAYVRDLSFEDALSLAEMEDEYEERKTELENRISALEDRKTTLEDNLEDAHGEDYDVMLETIAEIEAEIEEREEELDGLPDEMETAVKEKAQDIYFHKVVDRLGSDLEGWLEEYGYTDNLNQLSFLNIDYDKIVSDLRHDYRSYEDDGQEYVFSYEGGGKVEVGKPKVYPYYVIEMTTKKIVSGKESKTDANNHRKELTKKHPKLRFSVYPKGTVEKKYSLNVKSHDSFSDLSNVKEAGKVAINRSKHEPKDSEYSNEHKRLVSELVKLKTSRLHADANERKEIDEDIKTVRKQMAQSHYKHFMHTGSYAMGGQMSEVERRRRRQLDTASAYEGARHGVNRMGSSVKKAGQWIKKQWREADFGDGSGKAEFNEGGEVSQLVFIDGSVLGRIKKVVGSEGSEKYVVFTPDNRRRLGRFPAERITIAKDGIEVMEGDGHVDLFEHYERQPMELRTIVEKYGDMEASGEYDYADTKDFLDEVEAIGYTFDYYLDNQPYGLRPKGVELHQLEGYEDEMKKGGEAKGFGKAGTSRDWHMQSQEPHEQNYKRKTKSKSYAGGGVLTKDEEDDFQSWIKDGNAHKKENGKWVEQTTQWRKEFSEDEIKKFFKREYLSYAKGGELEELEIDEYSVKLSTDTDTKYVYEGTNKDEAYDIYKSIGISDWDGENNGFVVLLEKRTNSYKHIGGTDLTIEDYPLNEYYDDKDVFEVLNEGEFVTIESRDIEHRNKSSEELLSQVENWAYDRWGKFKYIDIDVYTDGDNLDGKYDGDGKLIGCVQLRISDHSQNPNNVRKSSCNRSLSVVIANLDPTESRYIPLRPEISFDGYDDFDEVIEQIEHELSDKIDAIKEQYGFSKGGDVWIQDAVERMKENGTEGAFTKQAKRHGMTPVEFAKDVLANPDDFSIRTRRRAQFVKNANPEKF